MKKYTLYYYVAGAAPAEGEKPHSVDVIAPLDTPMKDLASMATQHMNTAFNCADEYHFVNEDGTDIAD